MRLKCAVCGERIGTEDRAAKDADGKSYCYPCWDSEDEVALDMYRDSGSQAYDTLFGEMVQMIDDRLTAMIEQHGRK